MNAPVDGFIESSLLNIKNGGQLRILLQAESSSGEWYVSLWLVRHNEDVPIDLVWGGIAELDAPVYCRAGSYDIKLSSDDLYEIERIGWEFLLARGYGPTKWADPHRGIDL